MFFTDSYALNSLVKTYLLKSIILSQEKNYPDLLLSNISLFLTNNTYSLTYKTPLLQQLGLNFRQDNRLFLERIRQLFDDNYSQWYLKITISKDGWLEIKVCDRILNKWLNDISKIGQIEILKNNDNRGKNKEKKIDFIYYYTHARCCSILKSAHEQNLIELNNLEFKFNKWQLEKPELIDYQHLDLYDSYEGELIRELVIIIDKIERNKINYLTTLDSLTKRILNVEKHCRIWGKVLKKNKNISIARLGLITIALKYYQILIQAQFEQPLPPEL